MISGMNLYEMARMNGVFAGYYMNKDGEIYSTKSASGALERLAGSNTASGRYYTLNGLSYRHDWLKNQTMTRLDFEQEVNQAVKPAQVASPANRSHASTTEAGIVAKGYMIGRVNGHSIVLGSQPKIHLTLQSVNSEMERLAGSHPGVKFVRLKIDGSVVAGGVKWE